MGTVLLRDQIRDINRVVSLLSFWDTFFMSRALLYAQLVVVAALAALHLAGVEYHLYWRFIWLDTLAHTLGGMWAGLFVFSVRTRLGYMPSITWGIVGAIVLGILWEVFEVVVGIPREANYAFDTSVDLLMDTIGGILGAILARFIMRRYHDGID